MCAAERKAGLYDEVPYESGPYPETHPDSLATVATLFGMTPPALEQCRVLELGCAAGSNLIPMALELPQAKFVGVDLSPRQIADGQRIVGSLRLKNIDLRVLDLLEVDRGFGEFDYIICHGIFSWVPRPAQDQILAICGANLRPDGVAYVSYNTYPGWHSRGMVREMVRYHVNAVSSPRERVRQARDFLEFLARNSAPPTSPFSAAVKKEWAFWQKTPDDYVLHDPLGDLNEPVYFHQFARRLAEHGLQFIAEAELGDGAASLSDHVRQRLGCAPDDLVHIEQHLDFLRDRTFRRSLLCHQEVHLNRSPAAELIGRFLLAARAIPVASQSAAGAPPVTGGGQIPSGPIVVGAGVPLGSGPSIQQFYTDEGVTLSTSVPWVKAALLTLFDLWPRFAGFEELCRQARHRVDDPADLHLDPLQDSAVLKEPLLRCALSGLVGLHVQHPSEVIEIGQRPRASPLARLQAENGRNVTTLRHRRFELSEFDRQVLLRLDGRQSRSELLQTISAAIRSGEITFEADSVNESQLSTDAISPALLKSLGRLARAGLLEG